MNMKMFRDRLERLEIRRPGRGLSSERRKLLIDRAVLEGDEDALQELEQYRSASIVVTAEQRAAVVAAGQRADL